MSRYRFEHDWRDKLKPHDIIKHTKSGKIRVVRTVRMSRMTHGRLIAIEVIKQRCVKPYMHSPFTHLDRCVLGGYVKLAVRAKPNHAIDTDAKRMGNYKHSCTDLVGIP